MVEGVRGEYPYPNESRQYEVEILPAKYQVKFNLVGRDLGNTSEQIVHLH